MWVSFSRGCAFPCLAWFRTYRRFRVYARDSVFFCAIPWAILVLVYIPSLCARSGAVLELTMSSFSRVIYFRFCVEECFIVGLLGRSGIIRMFLGGLNSVIVTGLLFVLYYVPIVAVKPSLATLCRYVVHAMGKGGGNAAGAFFETFGRGFGRSLVV